MRRSQRSPHQNGFSDPGRDPCYAKAIDNMVRSTPLWQRLIWVVMFLLVVEGLLRKLAPSLQMQIYLLKDAILIAAYLGFISSGPANGIHLKAMVPLRTLLLLSLAYFGMQLGNPNSPSMLLSIVGLKNYLLYAPLAFVVPYMFTSLHDLEHKLRKYAIIMIPFAALGLLQFTLPPDHWINNYAPSSDPESVRYISMFGVEDERVRTTGPFSYLGGYNAFLTVMLYLGLGLVASKNWRLSGNLWPWAFVIVVIAAMFTTGSRQPIYGTMITAPMVLYIWGSRGIVSMRHVVRIGIGSVLISIILTLIVPKAMEAYQYRAQNSDSATDRVLDTIIEPYSSLMESPIIGTGIGSTHGSAVAILGTKDYSWLNGKLYEEEGSRVLEETGVIGFILVYATRIWLLVKAINLGVRFRTPLYAAMAGVIAGFFAQYIFWHVINNPTAGIYYWFAAGLLFAMYRLELQKSATPLQDVKRMRGAQRPLTGNRIGAMRRSRSGLAGM
jgi:hypothetical protein